MRHAPTLVLIIGMALRIAAGIVTPAKHAYDDHMEPTRIIVMQGRLPQPKDCWSCYQPPLYYVLSAAVFQATKTIAIGCGVPKMDITAIGQKAIQVISIVAGCVTLLLCRLILRRVAAWPPLVEAAGLAFVAFLPVHIRMSAMATNDGLTYAFATAAIYAVLRTEANRWSAFGCLVTGALCGAAVLTKAYGWIPLFTVCSYAGYCAIRGIGGRDEGEARKRGSAARGPEAGRTRNARPSRWRGVALVTLAALATSIWPAVRNLAIYGKPHVDNYEIFATQQRLQPPGSWSRISFHDLRLAALFAHPWLHMATLDSFWTEMYARTWFEYEGTNNSLYLYGPWMARRVAIEAQHPGKTDREFFPVLFGYDESATPGQYRWIARVLYAVGLPLTVLALLGLALLLWSAPAGGAPLLLGVHGVLCLLIPVLQTARIPVFAAMKIEFALCALSSAGVAVAWALQRVPKRGQAIACGAVLGLLGLAAFADAGFIAVLWGAVRAAPAT